MAESKTQNEFVKQAINGIFLIVLSFGLVSSANIVMPLSNFLNFPINWYQIFMLSIPYTVIVTSWMGFMASVKKHPYLVGMWGNARFIVDLFILFFYYLLLNVVSDEILSNDYELFFFLIPIFLLYLIWDMFKAKEYNFDPVDNKKIKERSKTTAYFFFAVVVLTVSSIIITLWSFQLSWDTQLYWIEFTKWNVSGWTPQMTLNIIFGIITYVLVIGFRRTKASEKEIFD